MSLEFQETIMCGNATCEIRITSGYVLFDSSMAQPIASTMFRLSPPRRKLILFVSLNLQT